MQFTVIVNTFDRAHFLPLVFAAWSRIRSHPFAMVLADDGSGDGTRELVASASAALPFPVAHVWHEKVGHRRAEILNKAVQAATSDALLFTDADCLPRLDLLDVYASTFRPDRLMIGGYIRMSPQATAAMSEEAARRGDHEAELTTRHLRRLRLQQWRNRWYQLVRSRNHPHIMGLNMLVARPAYVAVNGYDNNFRGWGKADGDLRERLKQVGVRPWSVWDRAITFHLHHPPDATKVLKQNQAYAARDRIPAVAENGLRQVAAEIVYRSRAV